MPLASKSFRAHAALLLLVGIARAVNAAEPSTASLGHPWPLKHFGSCQAGERGLRFDSPGVLDLAERSQRIAGGEPLPGRDLVAADAERVFAAPAIGEDPPVLRFSDDEFGCAKPSRQCSLDHERKLLAAAGATVARDGKRLIVTPAGRAPVMFVDWKQPATKSADGDEEMHWYLGRLSGSGYERVEVQFGHDAPGNFLINPQSGKVAFVHNGADLVAPSPDGRLLLTWNSLNPPLSLRVAALDADGPRLVLQCEAPEGKGRLTPVFKGWQDAHAFDFVIEIGEQGKSMAKLALELGSKNGNWLLGASDQRRLSASRLSCRSATGG
jgi:hypothetical protein